MYELKDYLNAINYTKEKLLDSEDEMWEKKYAPFIVNKCLAPFPDTIMLVNEINQRHHLDKKLQFLFLVLKSNYLVELLRAPKIVLTCSFIFCSMT